MIKIDFDNTYPLERVEMNPQKSIAEFVSLQINADPVLMRVVIHPHPDPLLVNVYNLAMGPPVKDDSIDDKSRLKHQDSSAVFSTAILFALAFLTEYTDTTIGLDGSDDLRATLYHSMFITNREIMNEYFVPIGVDWYVKLLRNRQEIERTPEGEPFFKPRPEPFDYNRGRHDLYRYYMIKLKD